MHIHFGLPVAIQAAKRDISPSSPDRISRVTMSAARDLTPLLTSVIFIMREILARPRFEISMRQTTRSHRDESSIVTAA